MRNAKENSRNAGTRNAKSHRNARPSLVKYLFRPQPHTEEPIDDSALLGIKYVSPLQEGFSASSALLRNKCASPQQVRFSASRRLLCFKCASPQQVCFSASSDLHFSKRKSGKHVFQIASSLLAYPATPLLVFLTLSFLTLQGFSGLVTIRPTVGVQFSALNCALQRTEGGKTMRASLYVCMYVCMFRYVVVFMESQHPTANRTRC